MVFSFQMVIIRILNGPGGRFESYVLQWGSEIQPSLDFEWSKTGWVANAQELEWDMKSGSPII